ncbi:hypothetical protein Acid345_3547 [Candidatus Koribacter versatilis Ellin345]|uniref:Uncharacterized protein n=1 Tax=Koribacter versatilis (strain Ellin345) TaxID=204669 RepID=Q1IKQ2_KORVE|nr:Ig domain-containing protein [Candidatus Koribacter versatilis]ABF42548.1 hypothetical protein Acid345_3547 [Candidatus Koribacter versatilis Ellin345]
MPYPASVFGPAVRNQVLRSLLLIALIPAALFLSACGGSSSSTTATTGVAPVFTSTAPTIAREGVLYTYDVTTTTSDGSTVTYAATTVPSGATFDGATLKWTPTHAESRISNSFTITATTSNNGTATQFFSVTPNGNIDGTAVDHAVTGSGLKNYNQDLSGSVVEALVPDGKGGYNTVRGSGKDDGTFSVGNIGTGSFWLHVQQPEVGTLQDNYIWTNASDVDLGMLLGQRPDVVQEKLGQTITTSFDLAVAPKSEDSLAWASPDAGAFGNGLPTSFTQHLVSTFPQSGGLIDSAKGDRGFFVHYSPTSTGLGVAVDAAEYDSITQTDGGTTNLTTNTAALSGTSTANPVIKITQWDALYAGLPGVTPLLKEFDFYDARYPGTEGPAGGIDIAYGPDLRNVTTDTDLGSFSYAMISKTGVPYTQFLDYGLRIINVGSSNFEFVVGGAIFTNAVPTSATPIVPVISLPRSVTVDGKDFLSDQTNISLSPQISWSTPSTGTPTSYALYVYDTSKFNAIASFYTNGNSVTVPAGMLHAGSTYIFYLEAFLSQSTTFATAPFRTGTSQAISFVVSGIMTTAGGASASGVPSETKQKFRVTPRFVGAPKVAKQ